MQQTLFARSAGFAAVATATWIVWYVLGAPILGGRNALNLYLVLLATAYALLLDANFVRRIGVAAATFVVALFVALVTRTPAELCIALAALLGALRSGLLYRRSCARAVAIEGLLLGAGLLFARFLAGPTIVSTALAIWGFLLVQSVFFLVGGVRVRERAAAQQDPFDAAHERACSLLDGAAI